ncbi:hypothetical protein N657DRAFT_616959 [Parathielavia appendiculata]|uniref:Heterokaryon incompatibility domain-containing protein n=1 Tax=Parathielavia appendiculata TaxID=2587402 RepID=A0AAN6U2P2_9PEZI|nr:hypothetical protein N657DRAFT_616959 [Parathielavia appendiculata]
MLEDCEAHHVICRAMPMTTPASPWLPTRLICLGQPGDMPRMIETSKMLLEPCSAPLRYTTLSHRWREGHPLRLTTETQRQLSEGVPWHDIPKTFADAMHVTRFPAVEYIWIDSLCIIRGDTGDWERDCTRMADVYRHGYCNIEATDSYGGCFSVPRFDSVLPCGY